jgi:hypothetical protein
VLAVENHRGAPASPPGHHIVLDDHGSDAIVRSCAGSNEARVDDVHVEPAGWA